jgi:hypothetical protein
MNRWRVGEDMESKETNRCPLTSALPRYGETYISSSQYTYYYPIFQLYIFKHEFAYPIYMCLLFDQSNEGFYPQYFDVCVLNLNPRSQWSCLSFI